MSKDPYISRGAIISKDQKYRYLLWREWRGTHNPNNWRWFGEKDGAGHDYGEPKACVFIMLNPSTANAEKDDPTIRRCVGFAKSWNFERLEVVNLFAHRATKPSVLLALSHNDDPEGDQNSEIVRRATAEAGMVICAWGAHGGHLQQDETALGWFACKEKYILGLTADDHPRHPLYVTAASQPVLYKR